MFKINNSLSNKVGGPSPLDFLRPPLPTKYEPLSDSMVAGIPNRLMASRKASTALCNLVFAGEGITGPFAFVFRTV